MQTEIKIITEDSELGFHLVEGNRFPSRRPLIVPGEVILSSESLASGDESVGYFDIISIVVDIGEDASLSEFATWFYDKLADRTQKIRTLIIAGVDTKISESEILRALEEAVKEKAADCS